jgi:hypothetical protein
MIFQQLDLRNQQLPHRRLSAQQKKDNSTTTATITGVASAAAHLLPEGRNRSSVVLLHASVVERTTAAQVGRQ